MMVILMASRRFGRSHATLCIDPRYSCSGSRGKTIYGTGIVYVDRTFTAPEEFM